MMEVAMLQMSVPKPVVAPPPPPAPPQVVKKPEPVKPVVKPLPKIVQPVVKKVTDTAPAEKVAVAEPVAQAADPTPAPPAPAVSSTSQSHTPVKSEAEEYTPANFHATYASNPKPEYPAIARSREWQGKVLLRVQVSAAGLSDDVKVERSSGHEILDDCAVEAVRKWKFIPGKRGDTAVASSVLVPINFSLND
jgi:periplasmic protein TonB